MSVKGIEHVAIAVPDLAPALRIYCELFGWHNEGIEEVADQEARVARLTRGPFTIELVEPLGPTSSVAKFLAKRGPGLHHVCFEVTDIRAMLVQLADAGVQLIDQAPRAGAHDCQIAFVHPKATGGVLIELSEPKADEADATQVGMLTDQVEPAGVERMIRAMEASWATSDFDRLGRHYHLDVEFSHPFVAHGSTIVGRDKLLEILRTLRPVAPQAEAGRQIERIFVAGRQATIEWGRTGPGAGAVTTVELLHGQILRSRTYCDRAAMVRADFSVPV